MNLFDGPIHITNILDDSYARILASCKILPSTDLEKLRWELSGIKYAHLDSSFFWHGENAYGVKTPGPKELRNLATETETFLRDKIRFLHDGYLIFEEFYEEDFHVMKQFPPVLERFMELAEEMIGEAEKIKNKTSKHVRSGPVRDVPFSNFFEQLFHVYERITGKKATSNAVRKADPLEFYEEGEIREKLPTEFQNFVRICAVELGVGIIDTLDAKTHDLLIKLRRKLRETH